MSQTYHSSTGPKVIAEMNPHNLYAAHAKLVREGDPIRQAEVDAMAAEIATREAAEVSHG